MLSPVRRKPCPPAPLVYATIGRRYGSRLEPEAIALRFAAAFREQERLDHASDLRTSEEREVRRWRHIVAAVLDDVADPEACFRELFEHFARPESWRCAPGTETTMEGLTARGLRLGLASNYDRRLYPVAAGLPALRRIKHRYKTGCITNNVPQLQVVSSPEAEAESMQAEAEQVEEQNAPALGPKARQDTFYRHEIMALFDHIIESSKVGIRKPDPRIYEMMCEALSVRPSSCIYLDDLGVNLKPARAMGMHTIKVESDAQAIAELEAATGMTLR